MRFISRTLCLQSERSLLAPPPLSDGTHFYSWSFIFTFEDDDHHIVIYHRHYRHHHHSHHIIIIVSQHIIVSSMHLKGWSELYLSRKLLDTSVLKTFIYHARVQRPKTAMLTISVVVVMWWWLWWWWWWWWWRLVMMTSGSNILSGSGLALLGLGALSEPTRFLLSQDTPTHRSNQAATYLKF